MFRVGAGYPFDKRWTAIFNIGYDHTTQGSISIQYQRMVPSGTIYQMMGMILFLLKLVMERRGDLLINMKMGTIIYLVLAFK